MKSLSFGQIRDLAARSHLSLILLLPALLDGQPAQGTDHLFNPYTTLENLSSLGLISHEESCRFRPRQLVRRFRNHTSTLAEQQADWACLAVEDTVRRDSMVDCRPRPTDLLNASESPRRLIYGTIAYLGIIEKSYIYELMVDEQGISHISLRIAFKNTLETDSNAMAIKVERAEGTWNRNVPIELTGKLRFHFSVVPQGTNAHFELNLQATDTRGPYDKNWSLAWSEHDVTHELGHMMGLDDEYRQLRQTFRIARLRHRAETATVTRQLNEAELEIEEIMNTRNDTNRVRARTSRFNANNPDATEAAIQENLELAEANETQARENELAFLAAIAQVEAINTTKALLREETHLDRNFCDPTSIMCGGLQTTRPLPYHYYLVLRRARCQ